MKTRIITLLFLAIITNTVAQDESEAELMAKVKADSSNPQNYWNLSRYYSQLRKCDPTFTYGEKALALDPKNAEYYISLAASYYDCNRHPQRLEVAKKFATNIPGVQSYDLLGKCCFRYADFPAAVFAYKKLASLEPDKWDHYYNIGMSYDKPKGNEDSAMAYYHRAGIMANKVAFEFTDTYENPWYKLFYLARKNNNVDYYMTSYDNMVKVDPNNFPKYEDEQYYKLLKELKSNPTADTYVKFADLLVNTKKYTEAVMNYEKAAQMNPALKASVTKKIIQAIKDDAYYTYFDNREYEKALIRYQDALKYTTSDPEVYSAIATIQMQKLSPANHKGAIENYNKALPLTKGQMEKKDILENIGLCYEQQKDYKNAIAYYDKVVAMGPNFAKSAHYKLSRVYEAMGNAEKALYHKRLSN